MQTINQCVMILDPVMPKGCPKAIAPPLIFSCSSILCLRHQQIPIPYCKCFLSQLTSLISIPARSNTCRHASIGQGPLFQDLKPKRHLQLSKLVVGQVFARVSLITTTAAAPSLRGQALPAVIVPPDGTQGSAVKPPQELFLP